jgi:hypothetical protein
VSLAESQERRSNWRHGVRRDKAPDYSHLDGLTLQQLQDLRTALRVEIQDCRAVIADYRLDSLPVRARDGLEPVLEKVPEYRQAVRERDRLRTELVEIKWRIRAL